MFLAAFVCLLVALLATLLKNVWTDIDFDDIFRNIGNEMRKIDLILVVIRTAIWIQGFFKGFFSITR